MLHRLIYRSRVSQQVRFKDAEEIAERSAKKNAEKDVTGLLVYTPSHFLQVLEGKKEVVEAIYEKVKRDPRHTAVETLSSSAIRERAFGDWNMEVRMPTKETRSEAMGAMDSDGALSLLMSLR